VITMKIIDLKTFIVGNPWKNWLFIKLYTDEGLVGLGEATAGLNTKPVESAIHEIKHLCIGEDPREIGFLMDKLRKSLFLVEDAVISHALSGINIACWDLIGKIHQAPLYRLLGGKSRERLRAYANGWYQGPREPAFFAERAKEVVAQGYTALKFDPFGSAYKFLDRQEEKKSLAIVAAVRDAVGEDVDILIEGHDRFSTTTAIRLGHLLNEYHPMWFETPVISTDIPATNEVARAITVPVISGERFTTTRQLAELLSDKVVDLVNPEPLSIGGVTGLIESCAVAASFGAWVCPHNAQSPLTTAVNVHIGIATPNILIQECFDDYHVEWTDDVLSGYPRIVNGYFEVPEQPGIGLELNEVEALKHPYNPQNFLRLFESGWERRRIK
jgi:galactonate dehydratase